MGAKTYSCHCIYMCVCVCVFLYMITGCTFSKLNTRAVNFEQRASINVSNADNCV